MVIRYATRRKLTKPDVNDQRLKIAQHPNSGPPVARCKHFPNLTQHSPCTQRRPPLAPGLLRMELPPATPDCRRHRHRPLSSPRLDRPPAAPPLVTEPPAPAPPPAPTPCDVPFLLRPNAAPTPHDDAAPVPAPVPAPPPTPPADASPTVPPSNASPAPCPANPDAVWDRDRRLGVVKEAPAPPAAPPRPLGSGLLGRGMTSAPPTMPAPMAVLRRCGLLVGLGLVPGVVLVLVAEAEGEVVVKASAGCSETRSSSCREPAAGNGTAAAGGGGGGPGAWLAAN